MRVEEIVVKLKVEKDFFVKEFENFQFLRLCDEKEMDVIYKCFVKE